MSEYSVSAPPRWIACAAEPFPVDGRYLSNLQIGPLPQSEAQATRIAMLPQNVSYSLRLPGRSAHFSTVSRCESCIDRIFSLGPEPCPVCHQTLRKAHFTAQSFEDLNVQKEVVIRQRIAKWCALPRSRSHHDLTDVRNSFNKLEEDFITLRAYNDYLEEVEDISVSIYCVQRRRS